MKFRHWRWVFALLILTALAGGILGTREAYRHAQEDHQLLVAEHARQAEMLMDAYLAQQLESGRALRALILNYEPCALDAALFQRFVETYQAAHPQQLAFRCLDAEGNVCNSYPPASAALFDRAPTLAQDSASRPQLSEPFTLNDSTPGLLIQTPVNRANAAGERIQTVLQLTPALQEGVALLESSLTLQWVDSRGHPFWGDPAPHGPTAERTLERHNLRWQVLVGWTTPPPQPWPYPLLYIWIATGGLLIGALLLSWQSHLQARELTELVAERTEALQASEAHFRTLIETLPIGVFIHDGSTYLFANPTMAEIWQLPDPQSASGYPVLQFVQPEEHAVVQERIRKTITEQQPTPPLREKLRRIHGDPFIGEVTTAPTRYNGQPAVLGIIRDVTAWAAAEGQLHQLNQRLRALTNVNQTILHVREKDKLLQAVCEILMEERQYDSVWIGSLDRHSTRIQPRSWAGNYKPVVQILEADDMPVHSQSPQKIAIRIKKPVVFSRPLTEEEPLPVSDAAAKRVVHWVMAAPIQVHGQVTHILNLQADDPALFNKDETLLLQEMAGDIGFALERMEIDARQRETEIALRSSEERFRTLAEYSQVGIILIQENLIHYANPALARMFGYDSPRDLAGKVPTLELIAPESREEISRDIRDQLENHIRATRKTFVGMRQNGARFDAEIHGARITHANAPAIIATVVDVTERQLAWQRLETLSRAGLSLSRVRRSEEALQQAVHQALRIVPGDAANIYLVEDQKLQLVAYEGYDRLDINVYILSQINADISSIPTFKYMLQNREALLIPDTHNSDLWTAHPEADVLRCYLGTPLIVRGRIIGFLSVDGQRAGQMNTQDAWNLRLFADYVAATLEHLRLVTSLEEERHRLTLLYRLTHTLNETLEPHEVATRALIHIGEAMQVRRGLIYLWEEATGRITVLAAQGIEAETLPTLEDIVNAEAQQGLLNWVLTHREAALVPDVHQDPRWLFVPGVDEWVNSALNIPLEAQGQLLGCLSLLSNRLHGFGEADLQLLQALSVPVALALQNARFYQEVETRALQMSEALQRKEELDRMKNELIQNISHELRTPLALILGYAELLANGELGVLAPEQINAVEIITRRSRMLKSLVEGITLLWQIDQIESQRQLPEDTTPIELTPLTQSIVSEFQTEATANQITLECHAHDGPLRINGKLAQIRRIFDNLIGNALKFTPTGGVITVSLGQRQNCAEIRVSDTGIGIPADKLNKIFERFYQVDGSPKRRYGGVGLGLALVRAIAEAHGGTIWAESPIHDDPDHPGACMIVQLPLAPD